MSVRHLLVNIAGHHLIPCVLASGAIYLVLWLLFGPGRLRQPADRVLFLYASLAKAALALWVGAGISCLAFHPRVLGSFGLRLPALVPDGFALEPLKRAAAPVVSGAAGAVLLLIMVLALALLCYRWARVAPVYRGIYESRRAQAREFPEVFRAFEELLAEAHPRRRWRPRPRLMVIWNGPSPAFTMGIRPPIIVLSAELVEKLGERELRGILAHELGHVHRLDYVGRWLATVLRDIMVWNPFVVLWHQQLLAEQERASDDYAADLVRDPVGIASGLVEIVAYRHGLPLTSVGPLMAWRKNRSLRDLNERLDRLGGGGARPATPSGWPVLLLYLALGVFLVVQLHIALSFPRLQALLSRAH